MDIILSNNGYEVINLGIKQPIRDIAAAAEQHQADVIGMSGLLVKSTVVMKENLEELNSLGLANYPVLLGGAALTRTYVENDLDEVYNGDVYYARDAFEGLTLMNNVMALKRGEVSPEQEEAARLAEEKKAERKAQAPEITLPERSNIAIDVPRATPPFWGTRILKGITLAEYLPMLDERALFLGQWGLKPAKGSEETYEELVEREGQPRLRMWLDRLKSKGILDHAAAVYGYFPAHAAWEEILVHEKPTLESPIVQRFAFPRQKRVRYLSIPDFLAPDRIDVLPFQLVTMGQPIADFANELFKANNYRDYLEVHGLGVQLTEAMAEWLHSRIRAELALEDGTHVGDVDATDPRRFFDLDYSGARYSFGYGSCPDLQSRQGLVDLLQPERIGVTLSEELQLHPEQSTDAFVLYHPEAKYFNV